jgi:preprotein translocase subunit YajC
MSFNLISSAWAADAVVAAAAVPQESGLDTVMKLAPLIGIVALMYFMLIRPQQQRFNEHQKMVKELRRGDKVVTGGGAHATIIKLEGDDVLVVEIADNVRIKVQRASITAVLNRADAPANANEPHKNPS